MNFRFPALTASAFFLVMLVPSRGSGQIGGFVRGAVDNQIQKKIDNAISCAFGDSDCIKKAQADGKKVTVVDKDGKPVKDQAGAIATADSAGGPAGGDPPGKGVWLNYDFVPGDTVLFFDDFADDRVGDLPTHEDITSGNVAIVDVKGTKYLRTTTGGEMTITLPEALPQRFTLEFVYHRHGGNGSGIEFAISDDPRFTFWCDVGQGAIYGMGPSGAKQARESVPSVGENDFETCRLMVDGGYAKAYVNSVRIGQLNGLNFKRTNTIHVSLPNADDNGTLLTGIRIAAGSRKLFDALTADGRIATHGIFFDVNSATIRGESTPTLKEIGDMLTQHPDLSLTIEGHTDNSGTAAHNQTLSEQRAASVRQYLIDTDKVDGARLKSAGFGATKPVAPNDTPEGRQNNRRVELVKN